MEVPWIGRSSSTASIAPRPHAVPGRWPPPRPPGRRPGQQSQDARVLAPPPRPARTAPVRRRSSTPPARALLLDGASGRLGTCSERGGTRSARARARRGRLGNRASHRHLERQVRTQPRIGECHLLEVDWSNEHRSATELIIRSRSDPVSSAEPRPRVDPGLRSTTSGSSVRSASRARRPASGQSASSRAAVDGAFRRGFRDFRFGLAPSSLTASFSTVAARRVLIGERTGAWPSRRRSRPWAATRLLLAQPRSLDSAAFGTLPTAWSAAAYKLLDLAEHSWLVDWSSSLVNSSNELVVDLVELVHARWSPDRSWVSVPNSWSR